MKKLIKNGQIITASDSYKADILIDGESIRAIGDHLSDDGADIIDAQGKLIMPGGIDPHCHFDLPMFGTVSSDDHYTGHKAAAFGGTTTVMDFVPQDSDDLLENVEAWRIKADPKAAVDFGFHMNISSYNSHIQHDIAELVEVGITTLKVFTAYNKRLRLSDGEIFEVMRAANQNGMLTMLHAENGDVIDILIREALSAGRYSTEWHARTRPAWGAVEASLRAIALAAQTGASLYLVHMNTTGEVDQLRYGRERGIRVMGETCPQYLFFSLEDLKRPDGAKWVCSPPVRSEEDNQGLWKGLMDGSIQVVGTDHCPFFFNGANAIQYEGKSVAIPGKELGEKDFTKIPNGLPGVGDRMPVIWTHGVVAGRITPQQFVALMSTNPAKIFGLYPRKGTLLPGSDADIIIWDPNKKIDYGIKYAHHRTDYNLYEGWELQGYPEKVLLRGNIIVDGDKWSGEAGMGKFLYRDPSALVL